MTTRTTSEIIQELGETDQEYLSGNTHELAIQRSSLRLELVTISSIKTEQIHFLQEAIVLLEQARIEFQDNVSVAEYINMSLHLSKAYMMYFEITRETRFAIITQQILKPLAHYHDGDVYFMLAYASAVKNELALTQYWLKKYLNTAAFDLGLLQQHHAFDKVRQVDWFRQSIKNKSH